MRKFGIWRLTSKGRNRGIVMGRIILLVGFFVSNLAYAGCGVQDAKITQIGHYHDGHIFVYFNKITDCNCDFTHRLAFPGSSEHYTYIKSMVLLAYSTNATVEVEAQNSACSVHNNTAKLTLLRMKL